MIVIGITGPAGSGKDTVADVLVARHQFVKLSWATPLKAGMAAMGLPEPERREDKEKPIRGFDFTWRQAAQTLGTEWGRALDNDIWVKMIERRIRGRRASDHFDRFVISDTRFENEAAMVRSLGGTMLFLHGRQADLGDAAGHVSEAGLIKLSCDVVIDNSGSLEFTMQQIRATLQGKL